MHLDTTLRDLRTHALVADRFAAWLREDPDLLVRAARLLGSDAWARRAERVADAAMRRDADPDEVLDDLHRLRRLLSLDMMDDPASAEALRFAAIHPDDPAADEARLCCEAVERALPSLEAIAARQLREVA